MGKILLAEDDNDMRRFLVKALQNAGYSVASFDNGLSAYNRLREEPFNHTLPLPRRLAADQAVLRCLPGSCQSPNRNFGQGSLTPNTLVRHPIVNFS